MADGISVTTANTMLTTLTSGTISSYVQLHTGAPGSAGTANTSSVTTREAVTWNSPSGGTVTASNQPEWTNWAGTSPETDTDISFWTGASGGLFNMSMQLVSSVTMNTGDSLTLTSLSASITTAS
jgi:hypothetical protein